MKRPRLLIVDDDPTIIDVVVEGYSDDYDIVTAISAAEGLRQIADREPDVVVSDIMMPGMDGLQFLERVQEITLDVPVILLTAYKSLETVTRALQLGAFDMLDKPFSLEPLAVALRRALEQRRRLRQRRRIEQLARSLNRCEDLSDLLTFLEGHLAESLGLRLFSLFLVDHEHNTLTLAASNHVPKNALAPLPLSALQGPMERAIAARRAVSLKGYERTNERGYRYQHETSLTLPLLMGERLLGLLNVNDKLEGHASFDDADVAFLTIAAEHVASALAVRQQTEKLAAALVELRETQARLIQSEKLASVTKLIAGVAHELKNPLTSLHLAVVNLETALQVYPTIRDDQRLQQFVSSLHSDVDRLQGKVESFLSFARPERGERVRVQPRELIDEALMLWEPRRREHDVSLRVRIAEDLPEVSVDATAMVEALLNLLTNALEAVPRQGTISLSAGHQEKELWVEVQDDGPGIPREIQRQIFDLFFTTKAKGSGIGLSQVHAFCDAHGGRITVQSAAGSTRFIICLPT